MTNKNLSWFAALTLSAGISVAAPLGTAFTYQGRLTSGTNAANGSYDLKFSLFDALTIGGQVGSSLTNTAIGVTNGYFTVALNFGSVFDGNARWLEIGVRTNGVGAFTPLTPRQPLTPSPYALYATNAGLAALASGVAPLAVSSAGLADGSVTSAKILDGTIVNADVSAGAGIADTKLATIATAGKVANSATTATSATTANAIVARDGAGNFSAGTITAAAFSGNGGSLTSLNAAQLGSGTVTGTLNFSPPSGAPFTVGSTTLVGGLNVDFLDGWHGSHYWQLGGNSGVGSGDFLGTTDGQPLEFKVNGVRALRLEPTAYNAPNVIGGSPVNLVAPLAAGATVSGGGGQWSYFGVYTNRVMDDFGTIGGGGGNTAWVQATVGGGFNNTAGDYATVGGGQENTASGNYAAVGGGVLNTASASGATIPGGHSNAAEGTTSFAAGYRAKAHGAGSFVWGDSNDYDLHAWGDNQFVTRATGGYWLITAVDGTGYPTAGLTLAAGSGTWGNLSDRNAKTNCAPVDVRAVLEQVSALPLATWNYKTQDPSIRHLGPMAQDFHAAFGVGDSDKTITTVDADGVALAAIQGLNRKVDAENAALKQEVAKLKRLMNELSAKLNGGAR